MGIPIIGGNGKQPVPAGLAGARLRLPGKLVYLMQKKQIAVLLLPPLRTAPRGAPQTAFMSASAAKLLMLASQDAPAMITRVARAIYDRLPDFDRGIPTPYDELSREYREKMEDRAALAIMGTSNHQATKETNHQDKEEKPDA